jgi:hypothetical protein
LSAGLALCFIFSTGAVAQSVGRIKGKVFDPQTQSLATGDFSNPIPGNRAIVSGQPYRSEEIIQLLKYASGSDQRKS